MPGCLRATSTSSIILPAFTFSYTINWIAAAGYIFNWYLLRVRFWKKFRDWNLNFESAFCVSLLNRLIQGLGSWCIKGTEESTLGKDSSVPLMHHDPRDLGLICLDRNGKSVFGFKNPILDFVKRHPLDPNVSFCSNLWQASSRKFFVC